MKIKCPIAHTHFWRHTFDARYNNKVTLLRHQINESLEICLYLVVGRYTSGEVDALRGKREKIIKLLVIRFGLLLILRWFVDQDENRVSLLFCGRVEAQQDPDQINLLLVVENDQTTGYERFDGKRMTQQKTPGEKNWRDYEERGIKTTW